MATGAKVKRTYVLGAQLDPDTGEIVQPEAQVEAIVLKMLAAGWVVGGAIRIVFDRVLVGELAPATPGGPREPLGETVGAVIEYQANTPLNRESMTQKLLDGAYPDEEEGEAAAAGGLDAQLEAMAAGQETAGEANGAGDAGDDTETQEG